MEPQSTKARGREMRGDERALLVSVRPKDVVVHPHHPGCRFPDGPSLMGHDPQTCCYCAALLRGERDPLHFRYGGPGCFCS
jgi:hypothetical protein